MFLITGAASPLGIELVKNLTDSGESCILAVRDKAGLERIINPDERSVEVVECDLSCDVQVSSLCDKILKSNSTLRGFVHLSASSIEDRFDLDIMSSNFKINVLSAWKIASTCIPLMAGNGGGRILFVGSVGHKFGGKVDRASYASSKYLLEYFPRIFRESASRNVLVNTLRLGVMAGGTQSKTGVDDEAFTKRVQLIPTGSPIAHQEALLNIRFLCSMDNLSIHNAVVACTGGE
jgi:NAD(P)-dependent dehydrogenase (short-subunit alcohol dehydrogenase family)